MTQADIDRDEIIEMARQAGWPDWEIVGMKGELKTFAKLVAQHVLEEYREGFRRVTNAEINAAVLAEREACANVCEQHGEVWAERFLLGYQATLNDVADAIRARRGEA